MQQQQEDIEAIDEKVDMTIDTVIGIGDKVIQHDKEIGELETGLEKVEERVDDVEEDLGETKIKVEEIDNKVIIQSCSISCVKRKKLMNLMKVIANYK